MATYRKTKSGEWVVYAPAAELTRGAKVIVTTKAGARKTEVIASVGKPFVVDGTEMAYGYLNPVMPVRQPAHSRSLDLVLLGLGKADAGPAKRSDAPRTPRWGCKECGGDVQVWSDGAALNLCHDCF